jgi:ABC-type uncharacterized transport system permease subunit
VLDRIDLETQIKICYLLSSSIFILNGILYAKREQYSDSSVQIGLGIMFFIIGLAQTLTFDYWSLD